MTPDPQAPFIPEPPKADPTPPPWRVLSYKPFRRLWYAQLTSSLGDWIGIVAILSLATNIADDLGWEEEYVATLAMLIRVIPGFFFAPLAGALVDRWDRKKTMVLCDVARAVLIMLLPVFPNLIGLVIISVLSEVCTLLWAPAKDASIPKLVDKEHLAGANSLGMVAAYGTMPVAGLFFAALVKMATALAAVEFFSFLDVNKNYLALWFDGFTYLTSAAFIIGLVGISNGVTKASKVDFDAKSTLTDVKDGIVFLAQRRLVRGVVIGLAGGVLGGGALTSLGKIFSRQVLSGNADVNFGLLLTSLGTGGAIGLITLLWAQRWLDRDTVFAGALVGAGLSMIIAVSFSELSYAAAAIVVFGAFAGSAYVTGFTVLQEHVDDELRGRTFANLNTVIRLSLIISLVASPLFARFYGWLAEKFVSNGVIHWDGHEYLLPGSRITFWVGGLITIVCGLFAGHELRKAERLGEIKL